MGSDTRPKLDRRQAYQAFQVFVDTKDLNPSKKRVYAALIKYQAENGPIPDSLSDLRRLTSGGEEGIIQQVLDEFFNLTKEGFVSRYYKVS